MSTVPLIAHVIFRFDVGGLENGLVNLIAGVPRERYRHVIVCLTGYTRFRERLERDDVDVFELHKRPGHDLGLYGRAWRLFRSLRPDIVHTRNLNALEMQLPATLAGVSRRIHGEHGWDAADVGGTNRRHTVIRRVLNPLVTRYVTVSNDLGSWLERQVGVAPNRISRICNGVDTSRFRPGDRVALPFPRAATRDSMVIGTVGRMDSVKDQMSLARAFVALTRHDPHARLRLVVIGDGPERAALDSYLAEAGVAELVWLPGARDDVARILRGLDVFVLPSLNEGISNTLLEAMASGLPTVATRVGGNPELVVSGETGELVPVRDTDALARSLERYLAQPGLRRAHGQAGRQRVEQGFALEVMIERYVALYDAVLGVSPGQALAGRAH